MHFAKLFCCCNGLTARDRKKYRDIGMEHMNRGQHRKAQQCFSRAIDVNPYMAFQLIQQLQQNNIEFIVAPYEADAQLAFLSLNGFVSAVISEDSDLLAFGCSLVVY